jgi:hypothetical protein
VVAARKWIEFVRQLAEPATEDLKLVSEQLGDKSRELSAKTAQQQEALVRSQLARARLRLTKATESQREIRELLLLDEEPDGQP